MEFALTSPATAAVSATTSVEAAVSSAAVIAVAVLRPSPRLPPRSFPGQRHSDVGPSYAKR